MPIISGMTLQPLRKRRKNKKIHPLICVHGYRSNSTGMRPLDQMAKFFCRRDIATYVFDNPGTGNSKGFLNTPKQTLRALESVYLNAISEVTTDGKEMRYKHFPAIYASSLGTLAAVKLAAEQKKKIGPLILETPIIDMEEYLANDMGLGKTLATQNLREILKKIRFII